MAATYNHKHKQFLHGNYIFYFFISATQTEDYFMLDIILIFDPFPPPPPNLKRIKIGLLVIILDMPTS